MSLYTSLRKAVIEGMRGLSANKPPRERWKRELIADVERRIAEHRKKTARLPAR